MLVSLNIPSVIDTLLLGSTVIWTGSLNWTKGKTHYVCYECPISKSVIPSIIPLPLRYLRGFIKMTLCGTITELFDIYGTSIFNILF